MELVSSQQEILKAATDLPMVIVCFVFSVLFLKKKKNKEWSLLYMITGFAALLGTFAHAVLMGDILLRLLWVLLYGLMILAVAIIYKLIYEAVFKKKTDEKEKKRIYAAAFFFYILCAGIRLLTGMNMIAGFAVFAFVALVKMSIWVFKSDVKILKWTFIILFSGLLSQGLAFILPSFNGASLAHLFIIAALFTMYFVPEGREDIS